MKYIKTYEKQSERSEFIDYMLDFYGVEGTWREIFEKPLTRNVILKYVDEFIKKRIELGDWEGGDSFDREYFRDYLLFKLGQRKFHNLEYASRMRPYFSDFEIDAVNYNL